MEEAIGILRRVTRLYPNNKPAQVHVLSRGEGAKEVKTDQLTVLFVRHGTYSTGQYSLFYLLASAFFL